MFFFRTCRNDCCTICVLSFDLQGYLKSVLMIPCCIAYRDGSTKEEPKELSTKARGATNLQAIIEAIGGLTNIVQHQVGATNPTSALEKFRKLDPSTFKGTKDLIEVDNWLKEIERLFRAMEVSDEQQVILAVFVLKVDALEWWESTERTHGRKVIT